VDIVVTTIADEVVVLNWGVMVCLRRFRFERLLCFTLFLLVDLRDDEMGTRFLNLFSALDDPKFLLLIAGHDATNVLVVVLAVVDVVGGNDDPVVVRGQTDGSFSVEITDPVCGNTLLSTTLCELQHNDIDIEASNNSNGRKTYNP
jgi:hypothetical protein